MSTHREEGWQGALARLEALDWVPRHEHTREAVGALREYLQRQADLARALQCEASWPNVDVAEHLGAPPLPEEAEQRLRALSEAHALSGFSAQANRAYVRAAMLPPETYRERDLEPPFEPLLRAFELAGAVRREHRFLQAGLASIQLDGLRPVPGESNR